jgi:hypothetical protein
MTTDQNALGELVKDAKTATSLLAEQMLSDVSAETRALMAELQGRGWRVALEVSAGVRGLAHVCMTCVSPTGERRVMADIAEGGIAGGALQ